MQKIRRLLSAQNKKGGKILLEYQIMSKEYNKLEKKYIDLLDRMTLANTQTYGFSKSQKGINTP